MKLTAEKSWADLIQDRYQWAEDSFTTFLQKFDAERLIQTSDKSSRQVSVILYGPAQVGKTSLILTLLGIRDDCFTAVNTLLRGGQGLGTMSTARTYRYRMAKDDFWYFSHCHNGETRLSDEEAVAVFAGFRKEVEQGVREFESVDVFLPRRFFDPEFQGSAQLLIRDLPGTHSTNANEQYYVNVLANRYLASADVVLLTGKADALTFLKPEELDNAMLNDWHWQRHRYKIVLTRAYSDATIQCLIKHRRFDKTAMRSFLLEQINTMELGLPDSISEQIYPVECGHTWLAINACNDEFSRQCREIRRDVLQDLLASLHQASNPLSRLRTGYALPHIIQQQMAEDKRYYETEKSLLYKQRSRLQEHVEMYRKQVDSNNEKKKRITRRREELLLMCDEALSKTIYEHSPFSRNSSPSLDTLKSRIISYFDNYAKQWNSLQADYLLPLERVPEITNLVRVLNRLNGYWFDTYFREKTRREDEAEIELSGIKDAKCLTEIFHQRIKVKFSIEERALNKKIAKNERIVLRLERIVAQLLEKVQQIQAQIDRITHEFDVSKARNSQRQQESKNFLNVIIKAKNERAREIEFNAKKTDITRSERLAWILMYKALSNDFNYVKSLDKESCKVE